jgi:hypothetical protein
MSSSPDAFDTSRLALSVAPERLAIARLDPDATFPAWVMHSEARIWSVTRTPDELSVVSDDGAVPPSVERVERPFRALRVHGPIPFDATGVAAGLIAPLAAAGIPVFVISTFDTDWLLVREHLLPRALEVLGARFTVQGT